MFNKKISNMKIPVVGTMEYGADGFVELLLYDKDSEKQQRQVLHAHRYPSEPKSKSWAVWDCWIWPFKNHPRRMMVEKKQ